MNQEFQDFVVDPRLRKVMENLKRCNDIFNIVDHSENQHSEILKWLFDPREGHGQGDSILKDFLCAAYSNSLDNVLSNKDFFSVWTPSRISRTGFQSMMSFREYLLPSKCRLDLLMVDTVNKILLVVENKHGAKLGASQLEKYYGEVADLRARPAFKGYKTAHIVLDRNFGSVSDEEETRTTPHNRWAFLDYMWLQAGAERAEFQSRRGNQSAGLVIAYCQKQTDYLPPEQKEIDDVLADIAMDYREIIRSLAEVACRDIATLTVGELEGELGEKWIFAQHYPELVDRLSSKAKLSFIEKFIRSRTQNRSFDSEYGKRYISLFDKDWEKIKDRTAELWPVSILTREMREAVHGADKFSICIRYRPLDVREECRDIVHAALATEFPELKKRKQDAYYRTLGKTSGLSEAVLANKVQALYVRLTKVLEPVIADIN